MNRKTPNGERGRLKEGHDQSASSSNSSDDEQLETSSNPNPVLTAAMCHESTSGRSISSTESGSNGTAGAGGNLIPDENAPYSSRIGTPMQESSTTEKKPMGL